MPCNHESFAVCFDPSKGKCIETIVGGALAPDYEETALVG